MVTFLEHTPLRRPVEVGGRVVLEDGAPVVWFTFPGRRHDIGRFHRAGGTFTGIYANILTPVEFLDESTWATTDLFLDIWLDPATGKTTVLDRGELEEARARGWIDDELAASARREAATILRAARRGDWPPAVVGEWTLERVRRRLRR